MNCDLVIWTQPSGLLCLWQSFFVSIHTILYCWEEGQDSYGPSTKHVIITCGWSFIINLSNIHVMLCCDWGGSHLLREMIPQSSEQCSITIQGTNCKASVKWSLNLLDNHQCWTGRGFSPGAIVNQTSDGLSSARSYLILCLCAFVLIPACIQWVK